ncbi:phosphate ABC transporter permease PstA [Phreatobacter stygius]|uniref:Phosphate transport system permease protein PstA n=1 Tax=Phreatobacter stygius TaxID=1940610 RepID=A0A4D7AXW4_9HYPH|nr:phosphate ABC transporter permease PstA [Phreatobacter stygius]
MTDIPSSRIATELHTDAAAVKRLKARYRREFAFQALGLGALLLAAGFLVVFLATIIVQAIPAFTQSYVKLDVVLRQDDLNPQNASGEELARAINAGNFDALVAGALRAHFPDVTERAERRALNHIVSSGAATILRRQVLADLLADPTLIGTRQQVLLPLDDMADLYLKGQITALQVVKGEGELRLSGDRGLVQVATAVANFQATLAAIKAELIVAVDRLRRELDGQERVAAGLEQQLARLDAGLADAQAAAHARLQGRIAEEGRQLAATRAAIAGLRERLAALQAKAAAAETRGTLDSGVSSFLVRANGGLVKLGEVERASASGQVLLPPRSLETVPSGQWDIVRIVVPEASRRIGDREIAYLEALKQRGLVERRIAYEFFTGGASREPELAGVWVAIVGSFLTLLVTLALCFPVGVAAAIYLEEFAPRNRATEIIEVNINNLAAVPSIIYGLLGLAVFLNVFEMPRSAPVVGGLVLALMTLPIIIIAARAAIRAVPPSVKEAALGVGASHQQAVFHHVLPLAMPGILTGTILGMAHALGETAPLLMIGMVAFVVDLPGGFADAATLLPVQIFMWADFPEQAFRHKTAAAILVLLLFLIAMNALAVFLRRTFERRW